MQVAQVSWVARRPFDTLEGNAFHVAMLRHILKVASCS